MLKKLRRPPGHDVHVCETAAGKPRHAQAKVEDLACNIGPLRRSSGGNTSVHWRGQIAGSTAVWQRL